MLQVEDADFQIQSVVLSGFPPFPSWNGTISVFPSKEKPFVSIACKESNLVILEITDNPSDQEAVKIVVKKIIQPLKDISGEKVSSMCHCWSQDGSYLVVTYDRVLCLYDSQFQLVSSFSLPYIMTSLDIAPAIDSKVFQVAIGTTFGAQVYQLDMHKVVLSDKAMSIFFENTPIACVSFGACTDEMLVLAIATIDGRVGIWNLKKKKKILSATLSAPRITDIQFSPTKNQVVFATRKGNVYLFQYKSNEDTWALVDTCHEMVKAPKCEGRACSTLVTWWGQSPFLVVTSRDGNAALEVFDTISGEVCHRFRLVERQQYDLFSLKEEIVKSYASSKPKKDDGYSITGLCCLVLPSNSSRTSEHPYPYRQRLLCFDTSARLWLLSWDFIDVLYAFDPPPMPLEFLDTEK